MSDMVNNARKLADDVTGKPKDDVGWRDAQRMREAINTLADEVERLGKVVSNQAERIGEAQEVAEAIDNAASGKNGPDRDRLLGLSENLQELLREEGG